MIIIASQNGIVGIGEAMRVLQAGGSAVDAVETGIRLVEANPHDHSVGYSGYPNILGQVELDAGIMNGRDRTTGAVGAMQGYKHPISVARQIMDRLPHVLLVGAGAERFAAEMGQARCDLLTPEARSVWANRLLQDIPQAGPDLSRLDALPDLWRWVALTTDPERADQVSYFESLMGTVNMIARDAQGHICAGASTSGWAWKYPGRLGDSPVAGAGFYADDRYGAATCTGTGEMAIRASTTRSVVLRLQMGLALGDAGRHAMHDLDHLGGRFLSRMSVILMDRDERHMGVSNDEGRAYIYQTEDMAEPAKTFYTHVPTRQRWDRPVNQDTE
ncbi:MAG: N(4)-(beta-N-acetylglucosaminyl)-L-asparaginase [Chloroflexi bacterium]|nr:N(4)-(beta-N-acetylglucosaminyl)-L-asparaginase [Chloroflexota bacterium]MBU1748565.1 N(4)-(beta-N-acetylglucosaminyl)-L-asparaginase [Chloroflexota bacterium]MBU1878434.1 N(4)-(beta-N-acetylglucosaminyl)-L-asparaginase [Chloroflexota bacterium]